MAEAWGLNVCSTVVAHALLSPSLAVSRAQLLEGDPFPPKYRVICASGGGRIWGATPAVGGHVSSESRPRATARDAPGIGSPSARDADGHQQAERPAPWSRIYA